MRNATQIATRHRLVLAVVAASFAADISAQAQLRPPRQDPNQRQVYLVRQDQSDCSNSNVPNTDSPLVQGNVWVTRLHDGNTSVTVAMTAQPKTTYLFHLKCVRQIGTITTDDEGVANVSFAFPTNLVGQVYAFDMYPPGAPAGQKFQSAQVSFQ